VAFAVVQKEMPSFIEQMQDKNQKHMDSLQDDFLKVFGYFGKHCNGNALTSMNSKTEVMLEFCSFQ